jgi:glycosyltransferase involved in cell wall biosynthesis
MKNEAIRLLCVARLMPEKGHHYLFEAVRLLVDQGLAVELVLAGEGPLRAELESLSRNLGIHRHIRFLGEQTGLQVRQLFRDCDIGVLASVSESVGLANMEGMASGRPVVATAVLGVSELVEDRVTGFLCPPRDTKAIANAIQWILAHPDDTQLIVERGKQRVKAEFSRDECTRQLIRAWDYWDHSS